MSQFIAQFFRAGTWIASVWPPHKIREIIKKHKMKFLEFCGVLGHIFPTPP